MVKTVRHKSSNLRLPSQDEIQGVRKTTEVTKPNLKGRSANLSTGVKVGCAVTALAILGTIWYAHTQTQPTLQTLPTPQALPTLQAQAALPESASLTQRTQILANHVHPGYQIVGDGGCVMESTYLALLKTENECRAELELMKEAIHAQGMESQVYSEEGFNSKGFTIRDLDTNSGFIVGLNPQIRSNYKASVILAKREMGKPDFFTRMTQDIIGVWKKIHQTMLGHMPEVHPGAYRNDCVLVFHDDSLKGRTARQMHTDNLKAAGVSAKDIKFAWNASDNTDSYCNLSPRAKAIWSKIASFAIPPEQVPPQMTEFVDKLTQMVATHVDPVTIGATVHQEIVRIHPWYDGNGRFARLIMNHFLPTPVIFPIDSEYQAAVIGDRMGLSSFENYLRTTAIPWSQKAQAILAG